MADLTIKKFNGTIWENAYPETTVGQIVATGTPSSTTFLRGDGTWATPAGGSSGPTGYIQSHNAAYDTLEPLNTSTLSSAWVNGSLAGGNHVWSFNSGTDTGSNGTGPEGDLTQTGFWYTETSGGSTSDVFMLAYDLSFSTLGVLPVRRRLSFEYSAFGSTQGTFTVYASSSRSKPADAIPIFVSEGDVGSKWLEGRAVIPEDTSWLHFEVTGASSFTGDVCLCNVKIDDNADS